MKKHGDDNDQLTNVIIFGAGKLWTAPEILRQNNPPRRGTQRGDVYSYSIICYEIMMRTEPYNFDNITPRGASTVRQSQPVERMLLDRVDLGHI